MGSIIASCCGSLFAGLCCGACAQCKPAKSGPTSRIPYLFLLILSGVFATIMSVYGEKHWINTKYYSINCAGCSGNGSVFRVSFCLFLFELVHVVFIGLGAVSFHWLWFAIKFFCYLGAVIITFFFGNNSMYSNFGQFSRYGASPIYLLLQILILINCGYVLNETFKSRGNSGKKFYWWLLGGGSAIFYAVAIILLGLSYKYYAGVKCNTHNAIITISFVGVGLNCGLSVWLGQGNFFVSSIVSLYMAYLTVAGLQSSTSCNHLSSNSDSYTWTWIGVCLALVTLCYAGLRSNLLAEFFADPNEYADIEEPLLSSKKESTKDLETANNEDDDEDNGKSNYDEDNEKIKKSNYNDPELESNQGDKTESQIPITLRKEATSFHFIMTLAAAYMAMLLTNWGTAHGSIATSGTASMWANIACCWATGILFYWTILAPKCCPQRFDNQNEDDE